MYPRPEDRVREGSCKRDVATSKSFISRLIFSWISLIRQRLNCTTVVYNIMNQEI